jgi:DNA-binding transcriptional MerR regulator/methylmalonyl-CoA mutase cobalamin-binding subunit
MSPTETPALRIGAVSRRTGVAVATLRAWESRYEVLRPCRTLGGHRLYSEEDVDRVLAVLRLTSQGWSVSAAAASITAERSPARLGLVSDGADPSTPEAADGVERRRPRGVGSEADSADPPRGPVSQRLEADLAQAVRTFDVAMAEGVLDEALARLGVAFALEDVVMPMLRRLGEGWEDDPALIAAEHFATSTLRPRLHHLLLGARTANAPTCVAAAPAHEDHELGVLAAAAVASDLGFRVTYLGGRTPTSALERSVATLRPDVVLIGAMTTHAARGFCASPADLGAARLVVGGPGFDGLESELPRGATHAGALSGLRRVLQRALEPGDATG